MYLPAESAMVLANRHDNLPTQARDKEYLAPFREDDFLQDGGLHKRFVIVEAEVLNTSNSFQQIIRLQLYFLFVPIRVRTTENNEILRWLNMAGQRNLCPPAKLTRRPIKVDIHRV